MTDMHISNEETTFAMIQMGICIPKSAIMVIRLRAENQAGEKLAAMIEVVSKQIDNCQIYLADTLEAHLSGSRIKALALGEDWLQENRKHLGRFGGNIIRWDTIKGDQSFTKRLAWFEHLYKTDGDTHFHIDQYCQKILKKLTAGRTDIEDYTPYYQKILAHRMEELAGLSVIRSWTDAPEICPAALIYDGLTLSTTNRNVLLPQTLPVTFQVIDNKDALCLIEDVPFAA